MIDVADLQEVTVAEAARILGCGRARARVLIDSLPETYRTEGGRRRTPLWALKQAQARGWRTDAAEGSSGSARAGDPSALAVVGRKARVGVAGEPLTQTKDRVGGVSGTLVGPSGPGTSPSNKAKK